MAHHQLDELDEKILKLIIGNARMPFLEVARECNVSGAAIHQRIQKLTNLGVIKGSEFIVDNTKVGYETCAYGVIPKVSRTISKRYRSAVADTGSRGMPLYNGAIRPVYKNIRKEQPAFAKHHPQQASTIGLGSHRIAYIL